MRRPRMKAHMSALIIAGSPGDNKPISSRTSNGCQLITVWRRRRRYIRDSYLGVITEPAIIVPFIGDLAHPREIDRHPWIPIEVRWIIAGSTINVVVFMKAAERNDFRDHKGGTGAIGSRTLINFTTLPALRKTQNRHLLPQYQDDKQSLGTYVCTRCPGETITELTQLRPKAPTTCERPHATPMLLRCTCWVGGRTWWRRVARFTEIIRHTLKTATRCTRAHRVPYRKHRRGRCIYHV